MRTERNFRFVFSESTCHRDYENDLRLFADCSLQMVYQSQEVLSIIEETISSRTLQMFARAV